MFSPAQMALEMSSVILASVAIFELVGPLLVKSVVKAAGEVKALHCQVGGNVERGAVIVELDLAE